MKNYTIRKKKIEPFTIKDQQNWLKPCSPKMVLNMLRVDSKIRLIRLILNP